MKYLFSSAGLKALKKLLSKKALFAFDFDGTLTEITASPMATKMPVDIESSIKTLNKRRSVMILSGRGVRDLSIRLRFSPKYIVGNHGLETTKKTLLMERARAANRSWVRDLNICHSASRYRDGIEIENKTFSTSVHYRKSRSRAKAKIEILNWTTKLGPPPRLVMGKCVINVVHKRAPHKGTALRNLMKKRGYDAALYVGDDVTDEDVFRMKAKNILSVRVGYQRNSEARFYVKNVADVNRLIEFLVKSLASESKVRKAQITKRKPKP